MSVRKMHRIWIEQYDAAQGIKLRYGLKAAFEYLAAEKLLNFASAAAEHLEFARDLEIRTHIARVERELQDKSIPMVDDDDLFSPKIGPVTRSQPCPKP